MKRIYLSQNAQTALITATIGFIFASLLGGYLLARRHHNSGKSFPSAGDDGESIVEDVVGHNWQGF